MEYYYYVDASRKQAGPYELEALVAQGITPQTLVWKQGMENWAPAAEVPEVAAALAAAVVVASPEPPQAPEPPLPPAGQATEPYQQPDPTPAEEAPKDYLVWSILSTVLCCGGLSLSVAGLVMSILTRSFNAKGDFSKARIFSKLALYFTIGGTVLGFLYAAFVSMSVIASACI